MGTENNFVSYDRAQYIPMPDDQHLFSCGNRQYVYSSSAGSDLIIVVGGKLPPSADVRYSSINMVDMFPPGRTVKTVTDSDLRKFYKSGSDSPTYMIAFYPNLAAANRCRMKFPVTPYQVTMGYQAIVTPPAPAPYTPHSFLLLLLSSSSRCCTGTPSQRIPPSCTVRSTARATTSTSSPTCMISA